MPWTTRASGASSGRWSVASRFVADPAHLLLIVERDHAQAADLTVLRRDRAVRGHADLGFLGREHDRPVAFVHHGGTRLGHQLAVLVEPERAVAGVAKALVGLDDEIALFVDCQVERIACADQRAGLEVAQDPAGRSHRPAVRRSCRHAPETRRTSSAAPDSRSCRRWRCCVRCGRAVSRAQAGATRRCRWRCSYVRPGPCGAFAPTLAGFVPPPGRVVLRRSTAVDGTPAHPSAHPPLPSRHDLPGKTMPRPSLRPRTFCPELPALSMLPRASCKSRKPRHFKLS